MLNKHLKTNDVNADQEEFFEDQEKYMEQYKKEMDEFNTQFEEMMGKEFKELPFETKEHLEAIVKNRGQRIKRLRELKAPEFLIDSEYKVMWDATAKINDGEFAKSDSEFLYRTKYSNKEKEVLKLLDVKYPGRIDDVD